MLKRIYILVVLLLSSWIVKAQDPALSQFNAAPNYLNPAMTGFFDGDYRIMANFRSQWGSFTNAYRTINASFEMSFMKAKLRDDNFAVGLNFYNDRSGSTALSTNNITLNVSYKKALSKHRRKKHTLTLGIQASMVGQTIDVNGLIFDSQYNGIEVDPSLVSGETLSGSTGYKPDLGVGLLYQALTSDRVNMYYGVSYQHILSPNLVLLDNADYRLSPKLTGHFGMQLEANRTIRVLPSGMYQWQGSAQQLQIGSYVMFVMDEWNGIETAFSLGAWARVANTTPDAAIFAARIDFQNVTIGMSYDVNISKLSTVSNNRGSYELSLKYQGSFTTVGKRRLMIPCPII